MDLMNKDVVCIKDVGSFNAQAVNLSMAPYIFCDSVSVDQLFAAYLTWCNTRQLPLNRDNAKIILNQLRIEQTVSRNVVEYCNGLSLMDCYWLRSDASQTWETVNLYNNSFSDAVMELAILGASKLSIQGKINTPELTGQGAYPKCFKRDETGNIVLYKADTGSNKEADREVAAYIIGKQLGIDCVPYSKVEFMGGTCCVCNLITNLDVSILPAMDISTYLLKTSGENLIDLCWESKNRQFLQMVLYDGIVANIDRHAQNWGFYVDSNTNEYGEIHTLFDHNCAFYSSIDTRSNFGDSFNLIDAARKAYILLGRPNISPIVLTKELKAYKKYVALANGNLALITKMQK